MAKDKPVILYGPNGSPVSSKRKSSRLAGGSGNRLVPSATQTNDRARIPLLDFDVHRNVSAYGRRVMLTLGRHLFSTYDVVRGAVNEIAETAGSSFLCEYRGTDTDFKKQVEDYTYRHDRICDIAGWPYGMRTYRQLLIRSGLLDGDMGTAYVKDDAGQARLQIIPGHRIGSDANNTFVAGGPFDGATIIDGVIVGDYGQPLAYRVLTGDPMDYTSFVDVPSDRMILSFLPLFSGQLRGFSLIGFSAWKWQDIAESEIWERIGQKNAAMKMFQEYNEAGEPPAGEVEFQADSSNASKGIWYEDHIGGINTYFKSSDPNSKIEAVKFDRPSHNQQAWVEGQIRQGLYSAGWSIDYSLLPTKIGGAALRVLVDKLNGRLAELQDLLIEPAVRRFDAFRIPSAMNAGMLKRAGDWWNLEYQRPARLTGDRKYDSQVNLDEIKFGIRSRANGAARNGESDYDVRESNAASLEHLYTLAQAHSKKFGIPFELALAKLEQSTPNESGLAAAQQKDDAGDDGNQDAD